MPVTVPRGILWSIYWPNVISWACIYCPSPSHEVPCSFMASTNPCLDSGPKLYYRSTRLYVSYPHHTGGVKRGGWFLCNTVKVNNSKISSSQIPALLSLGSGLCSGSTHLVLSPPHKAQHGTTWLASCAWMFQPSNKLICSLGSLTASRFVLAGTTGTSCIPHAQWLRNSSYTMLWIRLCVSPVYRFAPRVIRLGKIYPLNGFKPLFAPYWHKTETTGLWCCVLLLIG